MSARKRQKPQPRWSTGRPAKSNDVGRLVKPEPIIQPLGVPPPVYVKGAR